MIRSAHPKPWLDRLTQYGAVVVLVIMLLSVPLQILLALSGAGAMLLAALFTLLLCPFVLLLTTATPALSLSSEGLDVQPLIWKPRHIPWTNIEAVKPYPLLPQADAEVSRKAMSGRRNYRPAEGIMLLIPSLPAQYRIAGFLAGEGGMPIIALTTRTHSDYDALVEAIQQHIPNAST